MSFFETIQAVVNTISIPISIISIIFLIKQSKQTENSQRSQVYEKLIENSLKIDQLMIEHPEFRKYIYGSEPITNETPDKDKLMGFLEFIVDVLDQCKGSRKTYTYNCPSRVVNIHKNDVGPTCNEIFLRASWHDRLDNG